MFFICSISNDHHHELVRVVKHAEGQEAGISPANQVRHLPHPERGRIDFLVCCGAGVQPTAKKFGVSYDSLRNHV